MSYFILQEKIGSCTCLLESESQLIFNGFAQALILLKPLSKLATDKFKSSTIEKK